MGGICGAGIAKGLTEGAPQQRKAPEPSNVVDKPGVATTSQGPGVGIAASVAPIPEGSPDIAIGSFLDVYSNSYEKWCPGVVQNFDGNLISVAYQTPGESPAVPNINIKTLPASTSELRVPLDQGPCIGAVVEVYSHSKTSWCPGVIQTIQDGVAAVAFFYPDVPPGAEPSIKNLQLGHQDLRLFGVDGAAQAIACQGSGHDTLVVGNRVEVYSTSMSVWCAGQVAEIRDGMVVVAFYYPDMDPSQEAPVTKELPLGHGDLKVCYEPAQDVDPAPYVVGRDVEVYSASRQQWLAGNITEVNGDVVTAAFKYPDMPADSDFYDKELKIGHPHLRLANA
jgi:hypothetical protein